MTSCWSKGRNKHYPYYLYDTKDCPSKRKSIPRADIEEGAEEILRTLQPTKGLIAVAKAMFIDFWEARLAEARSAQKSYDVRIKEIDAEIEKLLDRIVEASSPSVVGAYEKRIEKLERDKILVS